MLGMGVMEFWEMTLHDFFLKLHYYNKIKQQEYQSNAELVRLQTVALINIQLASKDKIKDAKKLWRFSWEEVEEESKIDDTSNAIELSKLL